MQYPYHHWVLISEWVSEWVWELSQRQSCSYEGLNGWQRVSIQSCILENKRLTRLILRERPWKHFAKTICFSHVLHKASWKIKTAGCIRNNYRTMNNKKTRFTPESVKSVKIISFCPKVTLTRVSVQCRNDYKENLRYFDRCTSKWTKINFCGQFLKAVWVKSQGRSQGGPGVPVASPFASLF